MLDARVIGRWGALGIATSLLVAAAPLLAPAAVRADGTGLVAQWHLDEVTGGATPDSSGNGLTGEEVSGTLVPGRFASALSLTNPNDGFRVLANPLLEPQRITVMAWVKKGAPYNVYRTIVSKGSDTCGTHESYGLDTGPDGGLRFFAYEGGSNAASVANAVTPASIWDNQWHAVAGTFDGTTTRLYVDGVQVGSAPAPVAGGPIAYGLPESRLGVGRFPQGAPCDPNGFQFIGSIDEARLYNRALTAGEVAYLQSAAATTPPSLPPAPPPPAPPPPGPVPNLRIVSSGGGGSAYRCLPSGSVDHTVSFSWWRLSDIATIDPRTGLQSNQSVKVASGATLVIPPSERGDKFYCEADDVGLHVSSATSLLSGLKNRPVIQLKPAYGNFRVRGIDVFQIVQPSSGAQTFGYDPSSPLTSIPFGTFCGGGTPTSYRQTSNPVLPCAAATPPQQVPYSGVRLDERKATSAIVYVGMHNLLSSDPGQPLDVTLSARVGGRVLSGAITRTISNPPIAATLWVTPAERGNPQFGVRFDVPAAWLAVAVLSGEHHLDLDASVSLPVGGTAGSARECDGGVASGCAADDSFSLGGVPVYDDLPELTIRSLMLLDGNQTLNPPDQVIAKALQLYPGGERVTVLPYNGSVDITAAASRQYSDNVCAPYRRPPVKGEFQQQQLQRISADIRTCRQAGVAEALDEWWKTDPTSRGGYNILMAVHSYPTDPGGGNEPGFTRLPTTILTPGQMPTIAVNDGDLGQPLLAAHEYGHALGLVHAGQDLSPANQPGTNDPSCGGDTSDKKGQVGESWPPDNAGRLQGTAAIPTVRRGVAGVVRSTTYVTDGVPNPLYDVMSYCRIESNTWLSGRNWNHTFNTLEQFAARLAGPAADRAGPRARAAGAAQALAIGSLGVGGAQIDRVMPADVNNTPEPPDPASPIHLRAFTDAGQLLGDSGVQLNEIGHSPAYAFAAGFPAAAAKIELVSAGTVLATRQRSRPPTVRLTAPQRHTKVTRRLRVSWVASDPDHDALMASVDYSSDGGHTWRHVVQGPSTGHASIPGRYLESSGRGRVRVVVNDGFSDATALSAVLHAPGTPPSARIVLPVDGASLQAGPVRLIGTARDDHTHRLRGRALIWFAGSKRLGTGEVLRAQLPAGRIMLRLLARDLRRRTTVVTRRLLVAPVALRLLRLQIPAHVGRRADKVAIGLATSVPATLHVGSHSYRVGPHARTVRIPLPQRPKIGILQLRLKVATRVPGQPALNDRIILLRA